MNYFDWLSQKLFKPKQTEGVEVFEGISPDFPEDTISRYIRENLPDEGPR